MDRIKHRNIDCCCAGFMVNPALSGYLCSSLCCAVLRAASRPVWATSVFLSKPNKVARWVLTADWKCGVRCDAVRCAAGCCTAADIYAQASEGRAAT
ncbi:hypothetical protein KCP70_24415 [Salmonella enterica subsp. enterica]|nr:hypothetical protein KCP70_24415 [Salmonella enterica subsp. enterica]